MFSFVGVFLLILFVKFSYIYAWDLPFNIDSVNHAYYITGINSENISQALPYYHYGFHYIVILISLLTGENIPKTILVFGQVAQTILPLVIYFPVHKMTNNSRIALFCVLVAGLGFSMPSIATSWGKYPALFAIWGFCYVFYASARVFERKKVHRIQLLYAFWVILVSALIHSRMLILLPIVFLAWFLGVKLIIDEKAKGIFMGVFLIFVLISLLNGSLNTQEISQVMQPYTEMIVLFGLLITGIPFSAIFFGRFTFCMGQLIALLLIFFVIRTPEILADYFNAPTFFDRPFLSMFLFIPLCILLGTGLAGLKRWIAPRGPYLETIVLAGFILMIFIFPNDKVMKPLPDAVMVGEHDTLLYDDIKNNLPKDAKILVANAPGYYYDRGLDGGAWIELITGRQVHYASYDIDFTSCAVITKLCAAGTQYIYVGNKPYSFYASEMDLRSEWYQVEFSYPDAKLYRIVACFTC